MISNISLNSPNLINYDTSIEFIDITEKILEKFNYTIYEKDNNNVEFPKNIKIETRKFLKEINKMNIHHYRCHIHIIADKNNKNTVNGTNLEISFTLSHRFKAEKGANKHSHIYLSIRHDTNNNIIIFDGYKKKGNIAKKILENTNADELGDFLIYENFLKMYDNDFDYIEQPIHEKELYNKCLDVGSINFNKSLKKSFFILRDNLFWSKLIKYSISKLFEVLIYIFKYKSNSIKNIQNLFFKDKNLDNLVDDTGFQDLIDNIKINHFPSNVNNMIKFNKLKNYIDTRDRILDFNNDFINMIYDIINIYNGYFYDNQLNKLILQIENPDTKNKLITEENNFHNLLKVMIIHVINEYINVNKSKKIGIKNNISQIYYCDIIKKIISSIMDIKERINANKDDLDLVRRYNIIYNVLNNIRDKLFVCDFLNEEINNIYAFINKVKNISN
jgi:hypothetical protein